MLEPLKAGERVRSMSTHTADAAAAHALLSELATSMAGSHSCAFRLSASRAPDLGELSQTERRQDVASIGTALPKIHHDLGMSANML